MLKPILTAAAFVAFGTAASANNGIGGTVSGTFKQAVGWGSTPPFPSPLHAAIRRGMGELKTRGSARSALKSCHWHDFRARLTPTPRNGLPSPIRTIRALRFRARYPDEWTNTANPRPARRTRV